MAKDPKADPWSDPNFIFTLVSLAMSMSVFLYFLKQLICATEDDWKDLTGDESPVKKKPLPPGVVLKPKAPPVVEAVAAPSNKKIDPPVEAPKAAPKKAPAVPEGVTQRKGKKGGKGGE